MDYTITVENQMEMNEVFKTLTECGFIGIREGAILNARSLYTCANIYLCEEATLNAPVLRTHACIHLCRGATLNAPKLRRFYDGKN